MRERPRRRAGWRERIDSLIEVLSPRWAARRAAWRAAREIQLTYRGARTRRVDEPRELSGSADYHLEATLDRHALVDRSRSLERNNAIAEGLLTRAVENVIGHGHVPQARTADDAWNERAEELYREWALDADARGMCSFGDMQALVFRSHLRDGDILLLKLRNRKLQLIESDQLADPPGKQLQYGFVDGVELDDLGKPIRFYVVDPKGLPLHRMANRRYLPERIVVPAEQAIYYPRILRAGQTRGLPVFAQSAWLFEQLDRTIEAVVMAARMAACFGLVITSPHDFSALPNVAGSDGRQHDKWTLEPASIQRLEPGESIEQISPRHPAQNFPEFITTLSRFVGLQLGLPLELVLLDFSRTNYSSARAALLQAYRAFMCHQSRFRDRVLIPVWRWLVDSWVAEGLLPAREDMYAHTWMAPGWQWVDPLKEAQANLLSVDAGFATLTEIAQAQGKDFLEIVEQRRRELQALRDAGVPAARSKDTRDLETTSEESQGDEQPAEEPDDDDLPPVEMPPPPDMERVRRLVEAIREDDDLRRLIELGLVPDGYTAAETNAAVEAISRDG